jgi:CRISPR-associated protein Cmr6
VKRSAEEQLGEVGALIDQVQAAAMEWMRLWDDEPPRNVAAGWREAWCKERAQVWGRVAEAEGDSLAIGWLHQGYDEVLRGRDFVATKQLKRTAVAGYLGNRDNPTRIGRLWHRMYPVMWQTTRLDGRKSIATADEYLELLTFFPGRDQSSIDFSEYLNSSKNKAFKRLW